VWLAETKRRLGGLCVSCGESDLDVLELDHIDPSTKSYPLGSAWGRNRASKDIEASKCRLLCGACHRRHTQTQPPRLGPPRPLEGVSKTCTGCDQSLDRSLFGKKLDTRDGKKHCCRFCESKRKNERKRRNRTELKRQFMSSGCVDCGAKDLDVLDFDHLPEFHKEFTISSKYGGKLERLITEALKCDVVCVKCHRRRTNARRGTLSLNAHPTGASQ
jgi:hypothetical protein